MAGRRSSGRTGAGLQHRVPLVLWLLLSRGHRPIEPAPRAVNCCFNCSLLPHLQLITGIAVMTVQSDWRAVGGAGHCCTHLHTAAGATCGCGLRYSTGDLLMFVVRFVTTQKSPPPQGSGDFVIRIDTCSSLHQASSRHPRRRHVHYAEGARSAARRSRGPAVPRAFLTADGR